jgi:hypothetical protein
MSIIIIVLILLCAYVIENHLKKIMDNQSELNTEVNRMNTILEEIRQNLNK